MSAQVQSPPEIKSIDRVYQIPIVHDSLSAIHSTLTTYTPTAYAYGQAITTSAYSLSTPIQTRLAPLIVSADGYALKGLDVAQAKFPTPFSIKTEDVVEGIRVRKDSAFNTVTRPLYGVDSVRMTPAMQTFQSRLRPYLSPLQSLTPIVDRIEGAINKLGSSSPAHTPEQSTSSDAADTTQVARLYNLRHQIYNISSDQLKYLQTQNVYM